MVFGNADIHPPDLSRKSGGFIDSRAHSVNISIMDVDDLFPGRPGDPLSLLVKQDLDPFSVEELRGRIEALKAEIARTESRISAATNHRASADSLFKR